MNLLENKEKVIIVICLIIGLGFLSLKTDILEEKNDMDIVLKSEENMDSITTEIEPISVEEVEIMVHLSGEVNSPGLIKLDQGDRLIDAIEIAGGLTKDADLETVNLARRIQDEEKIHIPKFGDEVNILENNSNALNSGLNINEDFININTCTKADLMTLPGVGDKTADKIIEYRENNVFNSIEDLKNISGIGDKKYDAIKDLINVK